MKSKHYHIMSVINRVHVRLSGRPQEVNGYYDCPLLSGCPTFPRMLRIRLS